MTPNPEGAGLIWKTAKRGKGVGEDIPSPLEADKMKEMTKVGLIGSHSTDKPTEQGMVIVYSGERAKIVLLKDAQKTVAGKSAAREGC